MNLLVCVSKTPETTAKIDFTDDNKAFQTEGVNFIMNPYDEWYALVRAVELKEKFDGKVIVLNVGPKENDTIIRKALAIGGDEAVRIDADPQTAEETAKYIADYAADKSFDALFFGKETIDYNGAQVPGMVAAHLDLPFLSFASKLEMEEAGEAKVSRDIEGGVEIVKVKTPFVVSAAKGLAEQRIPNMRGIMMAKRKPLEVIEPSAAEAHTEIVEFSLPPEKGEVKMIDPENMEELVRLLHEEAKVI